MPAYNYADSPVPLSNDVQSSFFLVLSIGCTR